MSPDAANLGFLVRLMHRAVQMIASIKTEK